MKYSSKNNESFSRVLLTSKKENAIIIKYRIVISSVKYNMIETDIGQKGTMDYDETNSQNIAPCDVACQAMRNQQ